MHNKKINNNNEAKSAHDMVLLTQRQKSLEIAAHQPARNSCFNDNEYQLIPHTKQSVYNLIYYGNTRQALMPEWQRSIKSIQL